jgi:exopolysaccharide biosynthesis polyprenyl glycosylphosphotransferase
VNLLVARDHDRAAYAAEPHVLALARTAPLLIPPIAGATAVRPIFTENSRKHRLRAYAILLASDLMCIVLGFAVGTLVRFGSLDNLTWVRISLAVVALFAVSTMHNRAYSLEVLQSPGTSVCRAVSALTGSLAVLFVVSYFLKAEQDVSRLAVGSGVMATIVALAVARKLIGEWFNRAYAGKLTTTVIITDQRYVQPTPGARIVDAVQLGIRPEPRNAWMIQSLAILLSGADKVVIVCGQEVCARWAAMLKGTNVQGEVIADQMSAIGAVGIGRLGDRTTLVVSTRPLSAQQQMVKRLFDLALAIPGLLLIAPLLVGVALAIKLNSRGPVLFRQQRVGLGNRLFNVYKFRSMAAGAGDALGSVATAQDDERVTSVGRFIRCTSIDELPQLFNVLNGTMSLVGPRPHPVGCCAGTRLFWEVDDRYGHRHTLKPGITGLAQIRGLRGTAHQESDLSRRLQADLEYMANWSLVRDLVILMKTFGVLTHPNAY